MKTFTLTLVASFLMITMSNAQETLAEYYQEGKEKGTLVLRPEAEILRVNLSNEGEDFAVSLEEIYAEAIADIPQVTRDGFLSNGVGKYLAKEELLAKMDIYQIEENSNYRDSENYDFSEFFSNIDQHLNEAKMRAKESLFFIINEDCRGNSDRMKKYGNLECWDVNINQYQEKIEKIEQLAIELK